MAGGHPSNASSSEAPGGLQQPFPLRTEPLGNRNPGVWPSSLGLTTWHRPVPFLGKTALHWAAAVNNARAARSLLQAGADKDAQDGKVQRGSGLPPPSLTPVPRGVARTLGAWPEIKGGPSPEGRDQKARGLASSRGAWLAIRGVAGSQWAWPKSRCVASS